MESRFALDRCPFIMYFRMISKVQGRCGFSRTHGPGRAPEGAPTGGDFEPTRADLRESSPLIY